MSSQRAPSPAGEATSWYAVQAVSHGVVFALRAPQVYFKSTQRERQQLSAAGVQLGVLTGSAANLKIDFASCGARSPKRPQCYCRTTLQIFARLRVAVRTRHAML